MPWFRCAAWDMLRVKVRLEPAPAQPDARRDNTNSGNSKRTATDPQCPFSRPALA
jgi:hypothetical protein